MKVSQANLLEDMAACGAGNGILLRHITRYIATASNLTTLTPVPSKATSRSDAPDE
jgi:hypothetical protein